jgi:protein TonB
MERVNSPHRDEERYRITTQVCMAIALVACLGLVHFWPDFSDGVNTDGIFSSRGKPVEIELIEQTQQIAKPPPPPAPLPPVVVPDDTVLDFEDLEATAEIDIEGDTNAESENSIVGPRIVAKADQGPKPIRFVEPEYTEQARKQKIKASVLVEVLVDEKGRVVESRIVDRFIHKKSDEPPVPVRLVGFGIEEAALSAAERWRFRPARHGGRVVQTYYTLTFRFGV